MKRYRSNFVKHRRIKLQQRIWFAQFGDLRKHKWHRNRIFFDGKREKVLRRDEYRCQLCDSSDRSSLVVHHDDGKSKRSGNVANNELDNLITLCRSCHIKVHRKELQEAKTKRLQNRWSRDYDCCKECGTTKRRYGAHGLCVNCYARFFRREKLMI